MKQKTLISKKNFLKIKKLKIIIYKNYLKKIILKILIEQLIQIMMINILKIK